MGVLYAAALSVALWQLGSPPPLDNLPPRPQETFVKELAESIAKLADALKSVPKVQLEYTFDVSTRTLLCVIVLGAALVLAVQAWAQRRGRDVL